MSQRHGSLLSRGYIPNDDTLIRHVKPSAVDRDPVTDEIRGVFVGAFRLAEGDDYLSAGWIEFFTGSRAERISKSTAAFRLALTVRPRSAFVLGVVATIKEACMRFNQRIRVIHEPVADFDCHVAVRQFRDGDNRLLLLLAESAWAEILSAKP
jgi:hypothetical protein